MKDLKRGDLVYHKELGVGIVHMSNDQVAIEVQFEGRDCMTVVNRKMLFVKGDKVEYKTNGKWISKGNSTFNAPMIHNRKCDSRFTVYNDYSASGLKYVFDVRHVPEKKQTALFPEDELEILKTAERTVTNYPIQAQQLCKTMERAGQAASMGFDADKELKKRIYLGAYTPDEPDTSTEKKDLLKRLEILKLKSQIKELESEL